MKSKRTLSCLAAVLITVSLITACGSSGGSGSGSGDNVITANGLEPQNPLLPANTNEEGGNTVLNGVFSRLVKFDWKDGHTENDVAESFQTDDSKVWTIKIKPNWKFHDGSSVTATSFVKAWNWNAYAPNGQQNASFYNKIVGYDEVHPEDPDGPTGPQRAPAPTAKEMKGLAVIDNQTFKATLAAPFALFPTVVGYNAFAPLPESFYTDPKAFGEKPIGNGPFKLDNWNHNNEIKLSRFDDFAGTKPKINGVTFKLYNSMEAAYSDLQANNLDYLDNIPPSALTDGQFKRDLGEGRYDETPVLVNNTISFPLNNPKYQNPDFRRALSLSINREEISQKIFHGSQRPLDGYGSTSLAGYRPTGCEYCGFDLAKAKELFARSHVPASTQVGISYNADGPHKAWVEAACGSITNVLGLTCVPDSFASFGALRTKAGAHEMTNMFVTGWMADYPALENFLTPQFRTGSSANDTTYSNPTVDAKFLQADQTIDQAASLKLYQEAQKTILQDMPVIPVFEVVARSGTSNRVKVANTNLFAELDLTTAELK